MIKLAVSGCCGKMGRRIIALALKDKEFKLIGALEAKNHAQAGARLSDALAISGLNINIQDNPEIIKQADVLIEFTTPSASVEHLPFAIKYKKAVVIGTTGLDAQQAQKVKEAGIKIPVLFSPNMSVGVNVIFKLVKEAALKLGRDYRVEIKEAHHIHKKDSPSGTAKHLAMLIKEAPHRKNEEINIDSVREGEIVGEHRVRFNSPQDVITIEHSAKTRDIFAQGALVAAKFAVKQRPGLYDMQDVIESRGQNSVE